MLFTIIDMSQTEPASASTLLSRINYPLTVSVLAFCLSLTTSILSIYTNHRKDIHDQQAELATALRTISELNIKLVEIRDKYRPGTLEESRQSALIANQLNTTIVMASDIALRLGTNTTTSILVPISQGMYTYGDYSRAEQLGQLALETARSPEDEGAALRWAGSMKMRSGLENSFEEGNRLFAQATNLEQKYDLKRVSNKEPWLKAMGQQQWARALAPIACDEARKRFSESVITLNSVSTVRDNVMLSQLRGNAQREFTGGIGGVSSCLPSSDTPQLQ